MKDDTNPLDIMDGASSPNLSSDLCVALLVMPLALYSELSPSWSLGHAVCNMWVSFDVTCCTASILNLCTISVDRYLTITRPLTYGVNATARRSFCFIAIIWIASCLISVPPLLVFGNEHGTDETPECQVSQNIIYQLYATLGAFYIPLLVMIVMYYKIYVAAKRVVEAELKAQPSTTVGSAKLLPLNDRNEILLMHTSSNRSKQQQHYPSHHTTTHHHHHHQQHHPINSSSSTSLRAVSESVDQQSKQLQQQHFLYRTPNGSATNDVHIVAESIAFMSSSFIENDNNDNDDDEENKNNAISSSTKTTTSMKTLTVSSKPTMSETTTDNGSNFTARSNMIGRPSSQSSNGTHRTVTQLSTSSGRSASDLRERKASVTLGVIMTAFTVCWLPFFILALLRPFSQSVYSIPPWIASFALWLGYANSMLNPIIYVTFHQDFRKAFRYLLCFQCSSLGTRLREEAFQSQFGATSYSHVGAGRSSVANNSVIPSPIVKTKKTKNRVSLDQVP